MLPFISEENGPSWHFRIDEISQWFTLILFICTCSTVIQSPTPFSVHIVLPLICGEIGQTYCPRDASLPKHYTYQNNHISSFCPPPLEISISSLQFTYEWLIVMFLPFSLFDQKLFLKSAIFAIYIGIRILL